LESSASDVRGAGQKTRKELRFPPERSGEFIPFEPEQSRAKRSKSARGDVTKGLRMNAKTYNVHCLKKVKRQDSR